MPELTECAPDRWARVGCAVGRTKYGPRINGKPKVFLGIGIGIDEKPEVSQGVGSKVNAKPLVFQGSGPRMHEKPKVCLGFPRFGPQDR